MADALEISEAELPEAAPSSIELPHASTSRKNAHMLTPLRIPGPVGALLSESSQLGMPVSVVAWEGRRALSWRMSSP